MIITKRQIIDIELSKLFQGNVPGKFISQLLREPEDEFIKSVKRELNWTLDPIRKNLYIIT